MAEPQEPKQINHIIGCARKQRTAVLVVDYLKKRFPDHCDFLEYQDGHSLAEDLHEWQIIRISDSIASIQDESLLIEVCRALVAGCGDYDVWA